MDIEQLTKHVNISDKNIWELPLSKVPQQIYMGCLDGYCNLKCSMCFFHSPNNKKDVSKYKGRMRLEQYTKVLNEVEGERADIYPYRYAALLLIKDLFQRISAAKERNLSFVIDTNGLLLTKRHADFFVENRVDSITFSVDAFSKETLKTVRGIDDLEKIKRAVFLMLEARGQSLVPRVGVSFTLMEANRHEVKAFVDYWIKHVDVVRVNRVIKEHNVIEGVDLPDKRKPCYCLFSRMVVDFKGDATICTTDAFSTVNVGNVFKDGVQNVWNGEALNQIRHYHKTNQFDKIPLCKDCDGWADYAYRERTEGEVLIRATTSVVFYNRIDRLNGWKISQKGRNRDVMSSKFGEKTAALAAVNQE